MWVKITVEVFHHKLETVRRLTDFYFSTDFLCRNSKSLNVSKYYSQLYIWAKFDSDKCMSTFLCDFWFKFHKIDISLGIKIPHSHRNWYCQVFVFLVQVTLGILNIILNNFNNIISSFILLKLKMLSGKIGNIANL